MGKVIKTIVVATLMLSFVSCGKKNVVTEEYHQKSYVAPGPFIGCSWFGKLEVCEFQNVTCSRNWLLKQPNYTCYKKKSRAEGVVPEPTVAPSPTASILITPIAE